MIEESNVPNNWELRKLSEVCDVIVGNSPSGESYNTSGHGKKFIQGASEMGAVYPETKRYTDSPTKLCAEGDTIIAIRATIGDLNISDGEYCLGRGVAGVRANKGHIHQKYIHMYLKSFNRADYWREISKGATFNSITKGDIQSLDVPVPPLDEQERIVEAVEERLERVGRLEKSVENVGRLADEYQDSYLAYLVTGGSESAVENLGHKLTEEDVPDNWDVRKVSEVVSAKNGGTPKRSEEKYWGGNIGWLSSGEVKGKYTNSAEESINQSAIEDSSAKLFPENSVLVAMYGSGTRGQSTIITDEMSGNQAICCLIPNDDVLSEYLLYFYKSIEDRLASKARGAAQRNLNQSMVINEMIPVPPIEEQREIVKHIEKYNFSKVEKSSSVLSERFDEYKDSILSHAFKGDLRRLTSSRSERVS